VTTPFTTEGLGLITGGDGDVDDVVRNLAWEAAHPGGTAGREQATQLGYTARWPDQSVAATAYASLGVLMGRLDQAEAEGRCPVHGAPS
jgi:hypothetical protein